MRSFLLHRTPSNWPSNIELVSTSRQGGASGHPYQSLNLAYHVADDPKVVDRNRHTLEQALERRTSIFWLRQIHGVSVIEVKSAAPRAAIDQSPTGDACWTEQDGVACAIMTADCLPVLLTNSAGTLVAGVHAGWRGMAAGILEKTVSVLPEAPSELLAWLGPCIGFDAYEVSREVAEQVLDGVAESRQVSKASYRDGHVFLDLAAIAAQRLRQIGVRKLASVDRCTYSNPSHYFSHRRDGTTGRNVSLIYKRFKAA
ncbi:MAG: peptidoglycan editing factor PgeF [Pseudomonadota bacterium]